MLPIRSYIAEDFASAFKAPTCEVRVLAIERTFWEKATILHADYHRQIDKPLSAAAIRPPQRASVIRRDWQSDKVHVEGEASRLVNRQGAGQFQYRRSWVKSTPALTFRG